MKTNTRGFTLLEVMVSVLIFSMISVLIFSMLDRSFVFTAKGEARVLHLEQQYGLINLLRRQVQGAWFDPKLKKMHLSSETDRQFALITTSSLMFPGSIVVIAFYEFDPNDATLYYTERRDFYNPDYGKEFPPQTEMIPLLTVTDPFSLQADPDSDFVILHFSNREYTFHPLCTKQSEDFDLETPS